MQKGDEASEKEANAFAAKTRDAIARAREGIVIPEHRAKVDVIDEAFSRYVENFKIVAKLQHEHDSYITDKLDPTGDLMVEDLDKMIALAREENNQALVNDTLEAREHAFLIQVFVGRLLLEGKREIRRENFI